MSRRLPQIVIALDADTMAAVDEAQREMSARAEMRLARAEVLRRLIRRGLKMPEKSRVKPIATREYACACRYFDGRLKYQCAACAGKAARA